LGKETWYWHDKNFIYFMGDEMGLCMQVARTDRPYIAINHNVRAEYAVLVGDLPREVKLLARDHPTLVDIIINKNIEGAADGIIDNAFLLDDLWDDVHPRDAVDSVIPKLKIGGRLFMYVPVDKCNLSMVVYKIEEVCVVYGIMIDPDWNGEKAAWIIAERSEDECHTRIKVQEK